MSRSVWDWRRLDEEPGVGRWTRWFVIVVLVAGIACVLWGEPVNVPVNQFVPRGGW